MSFRGTRKNDRVELSISVLRSCCSREPSGTNSDARRLNQTVSTRLQTLTLESGAHDRNHTAAPLCKTIKQTLFGCSTGVSRGYFHVPMTLRHHKQSTGLQPPHVFSPFLTTRWRLFPQSRICQHRLFRFRFRSVGPSLGPPLITTCYFWQQVGGSLTERSSGSRRPEWWVSRWGGAGTLCRKSEVFRGWKPPLTNARRHEGDKWPSAFLGLLTLNPQARGATVRAGV